MSTYPSSPSSTRVAQGRKEKSPSALGFISDGRNGGGGRGHPGAKRGGRGGGRGRSNIGNGKAKSGDDDGKDAAEDGKKPAKGPMYYNCHVRGHFATDCKTKVCKKCGGRGHDESKCPSPADMETALAVELSGSDEGSTTSSVGSAGFMAEEVDVVCGHPQAHVASGKCDGSVPTCGVEGLGMQIGEAMKGWYFDTGAYLAQKECQTFSHATNPCELRMASPFRLKAKAT